jgi:L-iditol 2-dehydrogenase
MGVKFQTPIVVEPYQFTWFDVELPDPGPHEAIFRNRACLICGSDLHLYKGLHPFAPLPACCGHEVAADVVEVGDEVTSLEIGDRVYVAGVGASPVPCNQCLNCIRGDTANCTSPRIPISFEVGGKGVARFPSGFGEYTMGHEGKAYKIPGDVPYHEAAVTTDMAYVMGVVKRSGAKIGDSAAILGAGPIGLRTLEVAKLAGVSPIIVSEPIDYRRDCAKGLGADEAVNPMNEDPVKAVMGITDGAGVDIVFDTAGSNVATGQGLKMLKTRRGGAGTLILMGLYERPELTFNASDLMRKAGRIVAEWGVRTGSRKNIEDALEMMRQGRFNISKWITHRLPEDRADEAMMMLIEKRDNAIGVEIVH